MSAKKFIYKGTASFYRVHICQHQDLLKLAHTFGLRSLRHWGRQEGPLYKPFLEQLMQSIHCAECNPKQLQPPIAHGKYRRSTSQTKLVITQGRASCSETSLS